MDEHAVVNKLLEHDKKFEEMQTSITEFRTEMLTGMDKMTVILKRLDEERVFTNHTIKRHEDDIIGIKKVLKIA